MVSTPEPIVCPWCTHETTDTDTFRTHLMVEHRKSELARYVLEAERAATETEAVEGGTRAADETDDESEREAEIVAR